MRQAFVFLLFVLSVLAPSFAYAHAPGLLTLGWHDGFHHPFHGLDHIVTMVAVGIWAAQYKGPAAWQLPLTFVGVMLVGALTGVVGFTIPGLEAAILLSAILFSAFALLRVKVPVSLATSLVGLFAFFHGFAHGQEMPGTASLIMFDLGFAVATLILHGVGFAVTRVAMVLASVAMTSPAYAENAAAVTAEADEAPVARRIPEITVYGRQDSMLGIATSATQGTVGADQLDDRPIMRTGELLETVPGVIITQHAGGGKANQYFMRGFNLDHGTDFSTTIDGMPVNLPTHGHGQGYSDLNFVIPELIQRINYEKGVYYAGNGDFSSAGAAHLESFKTLPRSFVVAEGGMHNYGRLVAAGSGAIGEGALLVGLELAHEDGPWVVGNDAFKQIGVITYSQPTETGEFSLTARGYHARWKSSDQVATSAVTSGLVPIFGSLDDTTGGESQRYSLQGEWRYAGTESHAKVMAYAFYYDLTLYSNFTYFLIDPVRGDQFQQRDRRLTAGLQADYGQSDQWWGRAVHNEIGLQFRSDSIDNGLFQTQARQRVAKFDVNTGLPLAAVTRQDHILENSIGLYFENRIQWADTVRTVFGLREDIYNFNVNSVHAPNSGSRNAAITSPKLSAIFGPWNGTEFYAQAGLGMHSNDARGVLTRIDPITGDPTTPATPLVRSRGAEVGVRTQAIPHLHTTLSLWWLELDSELVFVGDGGFTEASRPSRRYGVEIANYYTPLPWLTLDLDFALSRARFRDNDPAGNHIGDAIESVIAAGVTVHDTGGLFGSLRLRYFGARPLAEDNSVRSGETILLNGQVGYQFNERISISADVYNILDRRDHDIDYFYESRITPGAPAQTEIHFHPVEPRQVRFTLKAKF